MTEYETNPHEPGKPEPGAPEESTQSSSPESDPPVVSGDVERSAAPQPPLPSQTQPSPPSTQPSSQQAQPSPQQAQPGPPQVQPGTFQAPYPPAAAPHGPWQQPSYAHQPPPSAWQPPGTGAQNPDAQVSGAQVAGPYQPQQGTLTSPLPPVWTPPSAPPAGPPAGRPSRVGRGLALGAGALALAVASGVLGGWVAVLADDDDGAPAGSSTTASSAGSTEPAPVINRNDLANVAAAVQPSVVSIRAGSGEGSGVVYDDQGNIVTNNHVVTGADSSTVTVVFSDGKKSEARIVSTDERTDLAVVRVSDVSGLTPAKFGDSGAMRVGDSVIALGSPLGLQGTVTAGIISALDRSIQVSDSDSQDLLQRSQNTQRISGVLQTDAPINPGNSGGPLANTNGEVIGINTAILGSTGNIGVGFAIPSNKVKNVADQLIKGGKVIHPFLGVSVAEATNGGALVQSVTSGSPAEKAGLQQGDVITKLGDKEIKNADDLLNAVQSGTVGQPVELTFTRNGEQKTATVTLADAS